MTNLTTIEIDFEVYKLIEAERRSFGEPRNDALRRLLGLAAPKEDLAPATNIPSGARSWSGEGVTLQHGTKLRMRYNGRTHEGESLMEIG